MLRFLLDDPEELFAKLAGPRREPDTVDGLLRDLGVEIPAVGVGLARALTPKHFSSGDTPLPPPLASAEFSWHSDGQRYGGDAELHLDVERLPLATATERVQMALVTTGGIMTKRGVLIVYDKEPFFHISEYTASHLKITYGSGGTAARKLTTVEHLQTDMDRFLKIVGTCANACCGDSSPDIDYRVYAR